VLQATDEAGGLEGFILGSDGSGAGDIIIPAGGTDAPPSIMSVARDQHTLQMNGRAVFKFAANILEQVTREITAQAGLSLDEIDWIIPHQANERIIKTAARRLGLPMERFVTNLAEYGNTWAASVPLALAEALDSGQVQPDDKVLLVSFGAGLTWAAALVQLAPMSETMVTETAVSMVV
jgi:3-oxoacyl-[acyl-carrier-protein] synthase-3